MGKKKIVNLSVLDLKNDKINQDLFKNGFLKALEAHSIQVKGHELYLEVEDKIYVVPLRAFSVIWQPSFEYIYGKEFRAIFQTEEANSEMMRNLYDWTNPVLDEILTNEALNAKKAFLIDFKRRMKKDEEYRKTIQKAAYKRINKVSLEEIKLYVDRFIELGILEERDKIFSGYYADYTPEMLEKLFKAKEFSEEEKVEVVSQAFALERRKQGLSEKKAKRGYNSRVIQLVDLLPADQILDVFINNVLELEEFVRTKVTKKDILMLPENLLLEFLADRNEFLPPKLKITSMDLINEYGKIFTGDILHKFALRGYIEPQDFIEVYEINKALKMVSDEKDILQDEELRSFYTPLRLLEMKENQVITPKFLQSYLELQDFENQPERFHKSSQMLLEEMQKQEGKEVRELQDEILYFLNIGLCDVETVRKIISPKDIETRWMNDELTMEEILQYYQIGLLSDEDISKYYIDEELMALYEDGKISGNCLIAVQDVSSLQQAFCDGKISDGDFAKLYLKGKLTITDLLETLQLAEKEIDKSYFMVETISFQQIKELFIHFLIDYAAVLDFYHQGILDSQQLEEIKRAISTKKFFQELASGKIFEVVTYREGEDGEKKPEKTKEGAKKDFSQEMELISRILGVPDVERENFSLIESYNAQKRPTSLHHYRIFGSEELDGIVILQKSRRENAVFVMSALQMVYFLRGEEDSEGKIIVKDRMQDKAHLKEITGVEVIEHSKHFARNLVEAAARISPKIAAKLRIGDSAYIEEVKKLVDKMRETYLKEKEQDRND